MYRSFHPRRKEKIVTTILWFLALACSTYILWKINPYPIQRGIGWTKQKTEQFLNRCIDNTVSNTLPSLSIFFDCEGLSKENITQTNTFFSSDPFYQQFQNNIGCSPDKFWSSKAFALLCFLRYTVKGWKQWSAEHTKAVWLGKGIKKRAWGDWSFWCTS